MLAVVFSATLRVVLVPSVNSGALFPAASTACVAALVRLSGFPRSSVKLSRTLSCLPTSSATGV